MVLAGSHQYPVFMHVISLCPGSLDHVGDGSGQVSGYRGEQLRGTDFSFQKGNPSRAPHTLQALASGLGEDTGIGVLLE